MKLPTDYAARKAIPIFDFLTKYFPLAIVEVVKVAVVGNEQHNPGEPLHWARGKSTDQLNTAMRHIFDHGMGNERDDGGRTLHLAKAAWRLLAEIQLICERDQQLEEQLTASLKPKTYPIEITLHSKNFRTTFDAIPTDPVFCEHANECPNVCPCSADCYCKENTCRRPSPGIGPVST